MPGLEERMAKVEGVLEQVSDRLNHLETRIQALGNRIDALANRLDSSSRELRAQMNTQFRWTVGLIIVTWITVLVAVLFK